MSGKYDDIIHLSRPVSRKHRPMSAYDRAAQFSPFAALTGHDAAIQETARLTDRQTELGIDAQLMLDEKIRAVAQRLDQRPRVTLRYFQPDERKSGGAYLELTGEVVRVDVLNQCMVLADGQTVLFSHLRDIWMDAEEK